MENVYALLDTIYLVNNIIKKKNIYTWQYEPIVLSTIQINKRKRSKIFYCSSKMLENIIYYYIF